MFSSKTNPAIISLSIVLLLIICGCRKEPPAGFVKRTTTTALNGARQVPSVSTSGSGSAKLIYDPATKTLEYNLTWTLGSSTSRTSNMHFHGSSSGSDSHNSPSVTGITGFSTASSGSIVGTTRVLTDDEVKHLLGGKWYLNIYSTSFPEGELRGNIRF